MLNDTTVHAAELQQLQGLLANEAPGRGRVLVVHGVAGVGQADVVSELRRTIQTSGDGILLEGSCTSGPTGPYRPFQQIVQTLAAMPDAVDCDAVAALLAGPLDASRQESTVQALMKQVRVRDTRLNHMESMRRVLCQVAANRRTLVVINDLHAADDDTMALVDYLLDDAAASHGVVGIGSRATARPILVVTVNDDDPSGRGLLGKLKDCDAVTAVRVGRLDARGLATLLLEPALSDKLLKVTDGLPNRVRMLVDMLPDRLSALADSRLAGLTDEAATILRFARVFGHPIRPGALAVLSGGSRLTIERLRSEGFLAPANTPDGGVAVRVGDAWLDSAVLTIDDATAERAVHKQCAEHLGARVAVTEDDALHERIARHLLAAAAVDEAAEHALGAVRWLSANAALQRAADLLSEVLAAGPSDPEPVTLALVDVEVSLGRFDSALGRCRALADASDAGLVLRQARIHSLSGNMDAALNALARLVGGDRELPPELREVADTQLAEARLRRGDLIGAESLCEERLASGEIADPVVALTLRHTLGKISFWRADWAEAEARYQDVMSGLRGLTGHTARRMQALVLHNIGLVHLRTGRYEQAIDRIQEALGSLEALGEHFEAAVCGHNLGIANEYCQRYSMAISLFERSIDVFERFGNRVNLTGAVNSLGDLYLTMGETWRARKLLEYSLSVARQNGLDYFVAFNKVRLARVELLDGRHEEASVLLADAVTSFHKSGHTEELAEARLVEAACALATRDTARAVAAMDAAEKEAGDETAARIRIQRAAMLRRTRPSAAHTMACEAVDALRRLGQRDGVVVGLTEAALAARAGNQPTEATRLLASATTALAELRERIPSAHHEAFDALPMTRDLEAARKEPTAAVVAPVKATRRSRVDVRRRPSDRFHSMVGRSPSLLRAFEMIERLADCEAPILVIGESGTGKELVAQAICAESSRANRPFIRVNAAAFADTLLESELFGHEKGAFTGAVARKLGAFEAADGGTLFLDEIGDISAKTQVSLLRVLQEQEFRRVGGRKPIKVDVRIICATNRNLEAMVSEGTFRLDLYYRIKGLTVDLPPLRERGDDIELLTDRILDGLAEKHGRRLGLADDAAALLRKYRWPGNVRELENVLRSVYFFAQSDMITADELTTYTLLRDARPQELAGAVAVSMADDAPLDEGFNLGEAKRALEVQCIGKALRQTGGNITQAAKLLGMKRPRLSQKIKEYRMKVR